MANRCYVWGLPLSSTTWADLSEQRQATGEAIDTPLDTDCAGSGLPAGDRNRRARSASAGWSEHQSERRSSSPSSSRKWSESVPIAIKTIDQIMADERRDMYFIQFGRDPFDFAEKRYSNVVRRHREWFETRNLSHATAAPRGWLCGDPGCRVVYFDGPDDPRVAEYSAEFEDQTGKSLNPKKYQMVLMSYQSWLDGGGPRRLADDLAIGDDSL